MAVYVENAIYIEFRSSEQGKLVHFCFLFCLLVCVRGCTYAHAWVCAFVCVCVYVCIHVCVCGFCLVSLMLGVFQTK